MLLPRPSLKYHVWIVGDLERNWTILQYGVHEILIHLHSTATFIILQCQRSNCVLALLELRIKFTCLPQVWMVQWKAKRSGRWRLELRRRSVKIAVNWARCFITCRKIHLLPINAEVASQGFHLAERFNHRLSSRLGHDSVPLLLTY